MHAVWWWWWRRWFQAFVSPERRETHGPGADSRKNRNIAGGQRANHSTSRPRRHHREPSPLRDRLHNVSRCITRRAAAVDVRRPPRGRPQCLDHVRGRRCGKGQGGTGIIQGIRRPHQGLELRELRSVQGGRGGRGDAGKGDRHDGHRTRSVSGFRGHREGRHHQTWGRADAEEAGHRRMGLNGISGGLGGAVQRSPRPHVDRA
jgi:hypothetical protein